MFQKPSFGVVDPGVTAQHLGLVAVPRLPRVEVRVVAEWEVIGGQTHVTHGGLRQGAQAEEALEKHSVRSFLPQPLQHGHGLAGVHQRDLHLCGPHPKERE